MTIWFAFFIGCECSWVSFCVELACFSWEISSSESSILSSPSPRIGLGIRYGDFCCCVFLRDVAISDTMRLGDGEGVDIRSLSVDSLTSESFVKSICPRERRPRDRFCDPDGTDGKRNAGAAPTSRIVLVFVALDTLSISSCESYIESSNDSCVVAVLGGRCVGKYGLCRWPVGLSVSSRRRCLSGWLSAILVTPRVFRLELSSVFMGTGAPILFIFLYGSKS